MEVQGWGLGKMKGFGGVGTRRLGVLGWKPRA